MGTPPIKSATSNESISVGAKSPALLLRSIENKLLSIYPKSKFSHTLRNLDFARKNIFDDQEDQSLIEAIDSDFNHISSLFIKQAKQQFKAYKRSYRIVRGKFNVYPTRLKIDDIEASIASEFSKLNRILLSRDVTQKYIFWRDVSDRFDRCVALYNKEMGLMWDEIETLDKFRNDHGRFSVAKTSLVLATLTLILAQSRNVYENFSWIVSLW